MNSHIVVVNRIEIMTVMILIILAAAGTLCLPEIVETVDVEGRIFSNEANSKNIVIISAADLERLAITDMADLFSFFTTLNVNRRGAGDTSFDITMRGSNFEQVLLLVNGSPVNNPQTGHFNSDFPFSLEDIRRVEVIRGGTSTTYGAGAFAGVVNIILEDKNSFRFSTAVGGRKFFSTSVQAGKKWNHLSLRFSAKRDNSAGFYEGREFDNLKFSGSAHYDRGSSRLDLFAGFLEKDFGAKDFYAPFPSIETIKSFFYQLRWRKSTGRFDFSFSYTHNAHDDRFTLDRYRPAFFYNESRTTQRHLNLSAIYKKGRLNAELGIDFKREAMDSSSMGEHLRNRGAFFLDINFIVDPYTGVDTGIRQTYITGGTAAFTFYTGIYRFLGDGMVLRAGYGKSFRLPSFTELYYNSPSNIGDSNLEPESGYNLETSFSLLKKNYQLDLSFFFRDQRNLIDWIKYGSTAPWRAANIESSNILGIELTQRLTVRRTMITLGVERLYATGASEGVVSKYGLRFPDISIKANLSQPIGKRLRIAANYKFKRIYNTDQEGHFLDMALTVPLRRFTVSLKSDNVFNTIIEEIPGLRIPGRWFYLMIGYN